MWAKVDDGWWAHRKVLGLSLAARGMWVTALSWSCAQRNSLVPPALGRMVCGPDDDCEQIAQELVDAGLWIVEDAGWRIHDWSEYQEKSLAEKRAEAGRKGGKKSSTTPTGQANAKQTPSKPQVASPSKPEANRQAGALPVPALPDLKSKASSTDVDPTAEQFEEFWKVYPPRRGKKVGKANALIEWRKLTVDQRRRAYLGAKNLAASDELPKDAERFLRKAKGGKGDFPFDDWQTAADATSNVKATDAWVTDWNRVQTYVTSYGQHDQDRPPMDEDLRQIVSRVPGGLAAIRTNREAKWLFRDAYLAALEEATR